LSPLCAEESPEIDSAANFFGSESIYLFVGEIVTIVEPKANNAYIKSVFNLTQRWNGFVKPPIDLAFGFTHLKKYLSLQNINV
jgi:hypothetical protein